MLGLLLGIVSGCVQFYLLMRFTAGITGAGLDMKAAFWGILQFFIPLIVLTTLAFAARTQLMPAGIGMAAALIGCAFARVLIARRSINHNDAKERDSHDD